MEQEEDDDDNAEENDNDHAGACSQPPRTPLLFGMSPSSPPPFLFSCSVPTVPMSRATILLSHRFPMRDPSSFLGYFQCAARLPFSSSLLLRGAIPPLRPLLLPAGWRSTEVGARERKRNPGGGGRHFMEVERTRRRRRRRWWRRSHGRGSLSRTGGEREATRHGWSGVMEAGVDIVWHYRTNFPRRTLRYWFRRAQPKQPE